MAFVFDSTPTSATLNSFCTVAVADDYQSTKLNTAWAAATTGNKEKLLAWATRQFSTLDWQGSMAVITQPQQFPRKYLYIKGGTANSEVYDQYQFPWDTIPKFLQEATADFAGYLLEGDTTEPTGLEGLKSLKVESIELQVNAPDRLSWLPSSSRNLCSRYLLNSSKYSVPAVRVG